MSELRQNLITRDWVIIATERAKRPDQFFKAEKEKKIPPEFDADCPFCPGNEKKSPAATYSYCNSQGWMVRSIPNKFPALYSEGERVRKMNGIYRSISGVGIHEVIIEHPGHNLTTALLKHEDVVNIVNCYKNRYIEIRKDPRVEAIVIFKNHGESAGTSLEHPHSQLVATPIVPTQIRNRMEEAARYFDDTGECVFCHTLNDEMKARERLIFESDHFVAFVPYAALSPFHLWIFPKRHISSFDDTTDEELKDFALNLKTVLSKIYKGLNNPDYNYCIRSIPTDEHQNDYFHWYLTVVPKVSKTAGFELGSGMFINTSLPEASAKFLREMKVDQ